MTELKPDERDALIRALETGPIPAEHDGKFHFLGLSNGRGIEVPGSYSTLTPAGHLLAVELRKSDRLERAKGKLAEWESSTDDEWSSARLELSGSGPWLCELSVKGVDDSRAESDDPLTAVIEASKQTPWELEE